MTWLYVPVPLNHVPYAAYAGDVFPLEPTWTIVQRKLVRQNSQWSGWKSRQYIRLLNGVWPF